jgi:3-oxoacyl-[acyl-carrier protein] reductase
LDLGIRDRTALALGTAGDLGSAIARELGAEGSRVVLADRDEAALCSMADALITCRARASWMLRETADRGGVQAAFAGTKLSVGPTDILVNNPDGPPPGSILGKRAEIWASHIESIVLAVIHVTDQLVPGMRARRWDRVIASTSSGVIAPTTQLGLPTLRSPLVGWSKTLAAGVAANGVAIKITCPNESRQRASGSCTKPNRSTKEWTQWNLGVAAWP